MTSLSLSDPGSSSHGKAVAQAGRLRDSVGARRVIGARAMSTSPSSVTPGHAVAAGNKKARYIKDTQGSQDELSAADEPPDGESNNRSPRAAIAEKAASKAAAPARAARAGSAPA